MNITIKIDNDIKTHFKYELIKEIGISADRVIHKEYYLQQSFIHSIL